MGTEALEAGLAAIEIHPRADFGQQLIVRVQGEAMRVRLLKDHSPECLLRGSPNPWAFFSDALYLDSIGRKLRTGACGETWLTAICNDSDCSALAVVAERDILREIEAALRKGKR